MLIPRFISLSEVQQIHADLISSFGGTPGIRDEGLLESAISQPKATFGNQFLHPTIHEQAAAYLYHITMNHPFIDGNKRTAFAVMDTFIRLNGYFLNLTNAQAYNLVIRLTQRQMSKTELTNYLKEFILSWE